MSAIERRSARFGYKNGLLRWASSTGLMLTGGIGAIAAVVDLCAASVIEPVVKLTGTPTASHLRYTYAFPEYPLAAAAADVVFAALSAAVGGIGLARVLGDSAERPAALFLPPAATLLICVLFGAGTGFGSASARVGGELDEAWTKAHFSQEQVLPGYGREPKDGGGEKYYPNAVTLKTKDGRTEYFKISPVLDKAGVTHGVDVTRTTQAKAKQISAAYEAEQEN